jgi:hypothetical protein
VLSAHEKTFHLAQELLQLRLGERLRGLPGTTRRLMHRLREDCQASVVTLAWRGGRPWSSASMVSAPSASSFLTMSRWPSAAATWKAVRPASRKIFLSHTIPLVLRHVLVPWLSVASSAAPRDRKKSRGPRVP